MPVATVSTYREVEKRLLKFLEKVAPDVSRIRHIVEHLEEEMGVEVYASLLYLLCHLQFQADEAKAHWLRILEHQRGLSEKLGKACDFRVALLDYFVTVNQQIKSPKIIEIEIFQKTQASAIRDELTGLSNYSYFRYELEREVRRAERTGSPLSIAMFDVDYFKWYNDRNGHLEGDKALKAVAKVLRRCVRDCDLAARYGGEEFVIVLPEATKGSAFKIAERIRSGVEKLPIPFAVNQPGGKLTLSGGISSHGIEADDADGLIRAADQALYAAKGQGKNQICVPGGEYRHAPRVRVNLLGRLQRVSSETEPFMTVDLSRHGLRFQCGSVLAEGDLFRLSLPVPETGREIEGLARVVKSSKSGENWSVHAQFVQLSAENARILKEYLEDLKKRSGVF
jgi:diguanylate cyclase (GGDEF)-like protein